VAIGLWSNALTETLRVFQGFASILNILPLAFFYCFFTLGSRGALELRHRRYWAAGFFLPSFPSR
jgi:hypothetical protein